MMPPSTQAHAWLQSQPGEVIAETEVAVWNLAYKAFAAGQSAPMPFLAFKHTMIRAGFAPQRRGGYGDNPERFIIAAPQRVGGKAITRETFK